MLFVAIFPYLRAKAVFGATSRLFFSVKAIFQAYLFAIFTFFLTIEANWLFFFQATILPVLFASKATFVVEIF
jgi:hypothetical protein